MADLVRLRILGPTAAVALATERVRSVLQVTEESRDYPSNRAGDPGVRRYLTALVEPAQDAAPRARAEEATGRRDLVGEQGGLIAADHELRAQPWLPIRPGDVVAWRYSIEFTDGSEGPGATLLAVDDPDRQTEAGAPLRLVSATEHYGAAAPVGPEWQDFSDLWLEAGPARLTVIRAGCVVHGRPVQAGPREERRRG